MRVQSRGFENYRSLFGSYQYREDNEDMEVYEFLERLVVE